MISFLPRFIPLLAVVVAAIHFASCGTSEQNESSDVKSLSSTNLNKDSSDPSLLIGNSSSDSLNLEEFFGLEERVQTAEPLIAVDITDDQNLSTKATESKSVSSKVAPNKATEAAEMALNTLEQNALKHQKSVEDLRKINNFKDKTIASLSALNEELLDEIKRLKSDVPAETRVKPIFSTNEETDENLIGELTTLKNSLILKSAEIKDLRMRNDSLEKRISSLETTPNTTFALRKPSFSPTKSENTSSQTPNSQASSSDVACKLNFDAVVTSLNGKNKEAFYTEFFILEESLDSIMRETDIEISTYPSITSFAELWARSRKNSFLFPGIQKTFRAKLLELVENGRGKRIRTDIDGFASVEKLSVGQHFVIGTASLGKVGVTWSTPVILKPGINKLSLTLQNSVWSL